MLSRDDVIIQIREMRKPAMLEWGRLGLFTRYARGQHPGPWLPDSADREYSEIARKSAANWIGLVISAVTQGLIASGFGAGPGSLTDRQPGASRVWDAVWQPNGLDARQHALYRAAATHGYAYNILRPTDPADRGRTTVSVRPAAADKVYAEYEDPDDDLPIRALRKAAKNTWELITTDGYYVWDSTRGWDVSTVPHDIGVCPVVTCRWALDLLGAPLGEVEPTIRIQDRIVDAVFNIQMVSRYGAFPQKWATGMSAQDSEVNGYVDQMIVAEDSDTKFGQFTAADLRQYVEALDTHIKHLAAITQTPAHYLLAGSANPPSAEALAAAEAGLQRKVAEKQEVMGEGLEATMRLAARMAGLKEEADDYSMEIRWQDVGSRSLGMTADAIAKLRPLGVPMEMLVRMLPGWTQGDTDRMLAAQRAGGSGAEQLAAAIQRASGGTPPAAS